MLVVGRKSGERIICTLPDGETITVTLCRVEIGKARIGITAPASVNVLREELILKHEILEEVTPLSIEGILGAEYGPKEAR